MERRGLFTGLLIFGILANLSVVGLIATEKKESALVTSWQPYSSEAGGFSLSYPAGWQVAETNRGDIEFEARFYQTRGSYISAVASMGGGLMVEILKQQIANPLKYYHEKMIEGMQKQLGHFKGAKTSKMTVAGMDAYYTTFEYRSWNGLMGRNMKGIIVSLWDGENHLALKMVSPARDYDKMFAAFGGFLSSFKTTRMPE
jgi:hypothetical protein